MATNQPHKPPQWRRSKHNLRLALSPTLSSSYQFSLIVQGDMENVFGRQLEGLEQVPIQRTAE